MKHPFRSLTTTSTLAAVALACASAGAATNFVPVDGFATDPQGGAAEWDRFTSTSGTQGGGTTSGINSVSASDLGASILVPYDSPPGGILGGGESYYTHDGAIQLAVDLQLAAPFNFARVSYALVNSGMGETTPFPVAPTIAGANPAGSGSYQDGVRSTVFYYDFELPGSTSSVEASFGDTPAPFSSFRSIEGVRVEGFSTLPVPEPGVARLGALAATAFLLYRRRKE